MRYTSGWFHRGLGSSVVLPLRTALMCLLRARLLVIVGGTGNMMVLRFDQLLKKIFTAISDFFNGSSD